MVPFQSEISSILLKLEALSQILLCHHFDGKSPSRYAFHFLMLSNQHFFLKIAFWGSLNKLPRNTIKFKSKSFHWFYPVFTFCIEACMLPLLISSSASVSTSSELFSEFISRSCSMPKSWQLYSSQATRTKSKNFLFQQMLNQLFRYMISHIASFGILIVGHEWKMIRHCNFVLDVQNYLPFIFSQLSMYILDAISTSSN